MKTILAALALGATLVGGAAIAQPAPSAPAMSTVTPRFVLMRVYAHDMAKSEHFYREVFGFDAAQAPNPHERVFTLPDGLHLVLNEQPATPHGNGSFGLIVSDLNAVLGRVVAAGGTVTRAPATEMNNSVRLALVTDPDGTLVEVIQIAANAHQ